MGLGLAWSWNQQGVPALSSVMVGVRVNMCIGNSVRNHGINLPFFAEQRHFHTSASITQKCTYKSAHGPDRRTSRGLLASMGRTVLYGSTCSNYKCRNWGVPSCESTHKGNTNEHAYMRACAWWYRFTRRNCTSGLIYIATMETIQEFFWLW